MVEYHLPYSIANTKELVYIGTDLPDEYATSNYTYRLKGTSEKAKANAAQGILEMIEIATEKYYEENRKEMRYLFRLINRTQ